MPKSSTPALLLMTVRSCGAARVQRGDQVLGDAAQAEAAHHDRRAVRDARHRLLGAPKHFVHGSLGSMLANTSRHRQPARQQPCP